MVKTKNALKFMECNTSSVYILRDRNCVCYFWGEGAPMQNKQAWNLLKEKEG